MQDQGEESTSQGQEEPSSGGGRPDAAPVASGDPVEVFALHLRTLFASLDISQRQYALRHHYDRGTVSRYFSGQRLPERAFIEQLLDEIGDHLGHPVTAEARQETHRLFLQALSRRSPGQHRIQVLTDELADADRQLVAAQHSEHETREELHTVREQLQAVDRQLQDLLQHPQADRPRDEDALAQARRERERLERERDELRRRVAWLEEELERAVGERMRAAAHYALVERDLTAAEERPALPAPLTAPAPRPDAPSGTAAGGLDPAVAMVPAPAPGPGMLLVVLTVFVVLSALTSVEVLMVHGTQSGPGTTLGLFGGGRSDVGFTLLPQHRYHLDVFEDLVAGIITGAVLALAASPFLALPGNSVSRARITGVDLVVSIVLVLALTAGGTVRLGVLAGLTLTLGPLILLVGLYLFALAFMALIVFGVLMMGGDGISEGFGWVAEPFLRVAQFAAEVATSVAAAIAGRDLGARGGAAVGAVLGLGTGIGVGIASGLGGGSALAIGIGALTGVAGCLCAALGTSTGLPAWTRHVPDRWRARSRT